MPSNHSLSGLTHACFRLRVVFTTCSFCLWWRPDWAALTRKNHCRQVGQFSQTFYSVAAAEQTTNRARLQAGPVLNVVSDVGVAVGEGRRASAGSTPLVARPSRCRSHGKHSVVPGRQPTTLLAVNAHYRQPGAQPGVLGAGGLSPSQIEGETLPCPSWTT